MMVSLFAIVLLGQTNGFANSEIVRLIEKGEQASYEGLLIPKQLFAEYELAMEQNELLTAQLGNLSENYEAAYKCEPIDWRDLAITAGAGFLTGIALIYATQQ